MIVPFQSHHHQIESHFNRNNVNMKALCHFRLQWTRHERVTARDTERNQQNLERPPSNCSYVAVKLKYRSRPFKSSSLTQNRLILPSIVYFYHGEWSTFLLSTSRFMRLDKHSKSICHCWQAILLSIVRPRKIRRNIFSFFFCRGKKVRSIITMSVARWCDGWSSFAELQRILSVQYGLALSVCELCIPYTYMWSLDVPLLFIDGFRQYALQNIGHMEWRHFDLFMLLR